MRFCRTIPFALTGLLVLAACRPAKVQSYRIAKEAAPPPLSFEIPGGSGAGTLPSAEVAGAPAIDATASDRAALRWVAPADWTVLPPVSMRVAGYRISGAEGASAELTITAFPGDVGGDLANINRWRGQIGLAPIAAAALATEIQHQRYGAHEFKIVEMSNPNVSPAPQATLAAYTMHEGSTWFFKLTGEPALVAASKPAFAEFLQTIQPR